MLAPVATVAPVADPLSAVLLALGVLLVVVPSAVAGYLVAGAVLDLFTPA